MGLSIILLKKIILPFLLISAAFISTSFAGRVYKSEASKEVSTTHEEIESWGAMRVRDDEVSEIHERLLKVKTNDYGKYDSAPTMVKPPFKLIPN